MDFQEIPRQEGSIGVKKLNRLPVFDTPDDFPVVTTEQVRELLDEE